MDLEKSLSPFKMDKEPSTEITTDEASDHANSSKLEAYEFTPVTSQSSEMKTPPAPKKVRKKSALLDLLDQASKYQPQYEYSFPSSFLRKREPPKKDIIGEDVDTSTTPKRKKLTKKSTKNVAMKMVKDTKTSNTKKKSSISNMGNGTSVEKKTQKTTKRTKNTQEDRHIMKKIQKENVKQEKSQSPEPHLDHRVEDNKRKKLGKTPNTFVNWDSPKYTPSHRLFDVEYLRANPSFSGEIVSSSFLTHFHNELGNKSKVAHNNGTTNDYTNNMRKVSVRSVLYPDFSEEFVLDFEKENFRYEPVAELGKFIEYAVNIYIPSRYKAKMETEVVVPYNKAYDSKDAELLIATVETYNKLLETIPRDEIIAHLDRVDSIPRSFLHDFLQLVYTRSIHPHARKLKQYKAFSNYVYGELLPSFLTKVYAKCGLSPEHVFMDLGSGVGNCVIQASLEFGCQLSFGCEIMESASEMTEVQMKEFENRCKLWGLKIAPIRYSLRESFINNPEVEKLIGSCDVLLINNFLFDAKLNSAVTKLIQHTKPGCKIITLKNLRSFGYTLDAFNLDNILNKIKVERFDLENNSVSWTHNGGEYYISTVLDKIDESLLDPQLKDRRSTSRPVKYTR
ncbi:Histone-lysine N-methyltransferase, H3 lysine-79 specific [Nakaseomyces bracarensis]|uniref:Histone-lysine N-methyltransferase, H3 lysine-79 specific n=1 Tax=Nakaseomyces bracarensis TaxID=273131 RepID=A0ABR4NZV7_9SACH